MSTSPVKVPAKDVFETSVLRHGEPVPQAQAYAWALEYTN